MIRFENVIKDHRIVMMLILFLAIFLRALPIITNAAWGGDLGIYYGIATRMLDENKVFVNYNGWGNSYQYFPMIYLISISVHIITGLDLLSAMLRLAPIIGGLTVIVFYYIVMEITRNRKISIISSALLAVAPFHVYQTSHMAPLTAGHLFMLLSILLFLRYRKNRRYTPLLILSTIALILSHHLTTYFYLITVAGMIIWRNFKYWISREENVYDISYLFLSSILTFSYWRFVAKPVYYSFMKSGLGLDPLETIILYFVFITFMITLARSLRHSRIHTIMSDISVRWRRRPLITLILSAVSIIFVEIVFMFVNIPATDLKIGPIAFLYSLPIIAFSSLAISGIPLLSIGKDRSFLQGWLIAVSSSFFYALFTGNTTLYPDRHIEYLMVPMCVSSSLGILNISREFEYINRRSIRRGLRFITAEISVFFILFIMIAGNGATVYPARDSFKNIDERFSESCFSAIEWLKNNTNPNDTIATDLRLSDFVWAYGMNATFDTTNVTWTSSRWTDCIDELKANQYHGKVTYILIDDVMRNDVVCLGVFLSLHMTNESYEKFSEKPFELVYRNATTDTFGNEIHWAEIYKVNWSYIENFTRNSRISS